MAALAPVKVSFDKPPTVIKWSLGYTLNLGNFQSIRFDHEVTDYVREGETVEEASERVKLLVQEHINKEVRDAKKELDRG